MGARGPLSRSLKIVGATGPADDEEATTLADELAPGAPEKPEGMPEPEDKLWDALVPELDKLGLVCTVDGLTVDLALRHYLAARRASEELAQAAGVSLHDEKNGRLQKHPAETVFRLHSDAFLKYAGQLGMTFVSRARLQARGDDGDEAENPFTSTAGGG